MEKNIGHMTKSKSLLIIITTVILSLPLSAQPITDWIVKFEDIYGSLSNLQTDANGNVYAAADYTSTATFNSTTKFTSAGSTDAFLTKYSPLGSIMWAIDFKNPENATISDIALDQSGNVFVSLLFVTEINFLGRQLKVPAASSPVYTHAIVKINSDGTFGWAEITGTALSCSLTSDNAGNLYLFRWVSLSYPMSFAGQTANVSDGSYKIFMIRFDTNKNASAPVEICTTIRPTSIRISDRDKLNNLYIVLQLDGTNRVIFGSTTYTDAPLTNDILVKLNSAGAVQWHKRIGQNTNNVRIGDITCDNNNNIYIAGGFTNSFTSEGRTFTSAGGHDNFVAAYNQSGGIVMSRAFGNAQVSLIRAIEYAPFNDQLYFITYFQPLTNTDTFKVDKVAVAPRIGNTENNFIGRMDKSGTVVAGYILTDDLVGGEAAIRVNSPKQVIWTGENSFKKMRFKVAGADFEYAIDAGNLGHGATWSDTKNNNPANLFWNDVNFTSDDIFYTFNLTQPAKVTFSHCGSEISDSYMLLYNDNKQLISTNDDAGPACNSFQASISRILFPGRYYVVSEGYGSSYGNITTTIKVESGTTGPEGSNLLKPVDLGTITRCYNFLDLKNNSTSNNYGNEFGQASDDIFYKFQVLQNTTVKLSTCNSGNPDTYVYLANETGTAVLAQNDDNGPACTGYMGSLEKALTPGTYFAIFEGFGTNTGEIKININFNTGCRTDEPALPDMTEQSNNVKIYPNPASEYVNITIPEHGRAEYIQITDMLGNQIYRSDKINEFSEIKVSDYTSGLYLFNIIYPEKTVTEKLQIMR
jgi:hypothetical protein